MTPSKFQKLIWNFYKQNQRKFPWRETTDPYKIMVSELMLQQTQTARVIPKYNAFINRFPTIEALADAEVSEVLSLWSGLGYNRRAKFLHQAAKYIQTKFHNTFPQNQKELESIPGIGPYTAAAILVFSFNKPFPCIETNIRRVFIHHFFQNKDNVSDNEIFPLISRTIDKDNPREWFYALMDYGSLLKTKIPNPNKKSRHYTKQSKFEGSVRKIRGEIIRLLLDKKILNIKEIEDIIRNETVEKINQAIKDLEKDEMIRISQKQISLY